MQVSVQMHDQTAFERNNQQLRQHYMDSRCSPVVNVQQLVVDVRQLDPQNTAATCGQLPCGSTAARNWGSERHRACRRKLLPPSPNEAVLTGLNLLRLLVQNRIAEFHTELEVIPAEVCYLTCAVTHGAVTAFLQAQAGTPSRMQAASPPECPAPHRPAVTGAAALQMQQQECVRYIIQLEQWLMEGAFNKVLEARTSVPAESYRYFMDLLSATVRCACAALHAEQH